MKFLSLLTFLLHGDLYVLGGEVSTPSPATKRMDKGNKTDRAFLDLVKTRDVYGNSIIGPESHNELEQI